MQIYDGSDDRKAPPTNHTVTAVSVGRIACEGTDRMTIRKNGREDWSLFYCEAGCMHIGDTVLQAGQLWLYPPKTSQKYIVYGRNHTVYRYLHFTGSDLAQMFSALNIGLMTPIEAGGHLLLSVLDNIQLCMSENDPLSNLKAEYNILYLISKVVASVKKTNAQSDMMKRVTDEMEHSFPEPYDSTRYAALLNISVSRFNHLFKECVGRSPYAYYQGLRIENATALLENTEMKIQDVAQQCGFEDPLYFTQVFKRVRGVTPSQYRKENNRIK